MMTVSREEVACIVHSWLKQEGFEKSAKVLMFEAKFLFEKIQVVCTRFIYILYILSHTQTHLKHINIYLIHCLGWTNSQFSKYSQRVLDTKDTTTRN